MSGSDLYHVCGECATGMLTIFLIPIVHELGHWLAAIAILGLQQGLEARARAATAPEELERIAW